MRKVEIIIFMVMCIGTLFISSTRFVNAQITPKWFILIGGMCMIGIWHILRIIQNKPKLYKPHFQYCNPITIISYSIFIQAVYGIAQFIGFSPLTKEKAILGSFDNPAGFAAALTFGLPFCLYLLRTSQGILRVTNFVITTVIIIAIILSGSRSAIFCVLFISIYYFIKYTPYKLRTKLLFSTFLLASLIISLYFYKQDSANGRLFIWQCSIPMLKEKFITGYGNGGFEANYMNFQAQYFTHNPNSYYQLLADNIQHPFSEYIKILCNYGLIGLILTISIIVILIYCYLQQPTLKKECAILCIGCICIFAIFSYPLSYPFTWLIILTSIQILTHSLFPFTTYHYNSIQKRFLIIFVFTSMGYIGYKYFQRLNAEIQWKYCANLALLRKGERVLSQYHELKKELGNNRLFLYNYCNFLYQVNDYDKALETAKECRTLWANYNLELLIGRIYRTQKAYNNAKKHFLIAHHMCPIRFLPLYELAHLENEFNHTHNADSLAHVITKKPIKIPSPLIDNIKNEMHIYLLKQ